VYKLALGTLLLTIGAEEYAERYDLLWDFYVWACPGIDVWGVAILEPILEGGACLAVMLCWPYAYAEGRPMLYRRSLLMFFFGSLVVTVLTVLIMAEGELGKCATGQLVMVMFIYMMTLRPLVKHCVVMGFIVAACFLIKILASGIQCDVIADVAMVSATIYIGLGAAVAAVERAERAHFVAVQLAHTSHNMLLGLVDRMLPPVMAAQLVQQWGGHVAIGDRYDQVSVLFCELQMPAAEALPTLVDLNELFSVMDRVVDTVSDACKIETVGGQFVVAAGVPSASQDHAASMALLATRIRAALRTSRWSTGELVKMRIGIHSGPVGKESVHATHTRRNACRLET
jgi:adenylate cyclase